MLPEWLDFAFSENAAASMYRGLQGPTASWGELIASSQAIVGFFQEFDAAKIDELYKTENILPLVAAARIFDSASQIPSGLPEEDRINLGLCAAVAFGMYGNFLSAEAVSRRILEDIRSPSSALAVIIGTCAPNLIGEIILDSDSGSKERSYLELLNYYLTDGQTEAIQNLRDLFIDCILSASSSLHSSLARSCRLCLEHIIHLAIARNLHSVGEILPEDYIRKLIDSGVKVLLPTQFKAIKNHNFIQSNDNALVALPTSTGKTLLGELGLVAAFKKRPGIICYLAPYVALGRQIAQSFERHLPNNVRIHRMIGGFQATGDLEPETHFEAIVATPERFDALLRTHPEWARYIRCVVCDEAHLVQNDIRGIRLEGLITRLRLQQNSGRNLRLILLSAVLAQYEKLRVWLGASPNNVIVDSWQPTARRLAFWEQNARLTWYIGADPIRRADSVSTTSIGRTILPWPNNDFYSTSHLGQVRQQQPKAYANVAYLAEYLKKRYGGPILCVCSTKEGTRRMAAALAGRFEEPNTLSKMIENIIKTINNEYQFLKPMGRMLRHGVAFHNSTVPHRVRQLLEDAMMGKELAAIASTTTLAEGVDLPFRFTIIVDWLTWQAAGEQPMPSLLFRNIAGRCGRAGVFTEGDTIVFDNPLGDIKYTNPYNRRSHQQNIFLTEKPAELTSAFEEIRTSSSPERRDTLQAALASQFMAGIPENPNTDDLVGLFADHTFAAQRYGTSLQMRDALDSIRKTLLDESHGALAIAASPIRLTLFGEVANKTGFSPDSCRQIVHVLKSQQPVNNPATLMNVLLEALGALPEQTNAELKKMLSGKSTRFSVKLGDLHGMLTLWLSGERHDQMFQSLPFVRRSSRKPTIEEWLTGSVSESSWDTEFDKFVEFTTGIFEGFLPWLLRACGWLSDFSGDRWSETDWGSLAKSLERNPAAEQPT